MKGKKAKHARKISLPGGKFIDLFAGCGGLSLGLMAAGWRGVLAVEQDSFAFDSLRRNLIDPSNNCPHKYEWPSWLKVEPTEIRAFIKEHESKLKSRLGKLDLITGGPPCQGFSIAGRRKKNDPRNRLFQQYVSLVRLLKPSFVLLENVKGISFTYRRQSKGSRKAAKPTQPFSDQIKKSLENAGYKVFVKHVRAMDFGVPQVRPRYIMLAIREDLLTAKRNFDPFHNFDKRRNKFLRGKNLPVNRAITVRQAISDLEVNGNNLVDCPDTQGYKQIDYQRPRTHYQRLMHGDLNGHAPNSMRLIKHSPKTRNRFEKIIGSCRHGVQLCDKDRKRFRLNKHCTTPLAANKPSHTLTSLPDDFIHYSEARILTVREYARIQSFPDWYDFQGKYSTGGNRRLRECPRYTQVANAVPPFLAEFLGFLLLDLRNELCNP
jgi:DNA (cytosine-5)-methyltransferase 1